MERTEHRCSLAVKRSGYGIVVRTSDGHICPDVQRQAAKLEADGYFVQIAVDGMTRGGGFPL